MAKKATITLYAATMFGLAASLAILSAATAQQREAITGIDKIHAQAPVGGKVCMIRHKHGGDGTMPSRRGAEAASIRAWQVFTADEYGTAWGKYALAGSKKMLCAQSGGAWTCQTTAKPCRAAR